MQILAVLSILVACASAQYYPGFTGYYPYTYPMGYPQVRAVPFVAPVPIAAKTTFKTVGAEVDPFAKTPADTTKFDLKEKSFDIYSPVAYPYYTPYAYPFVSDVVAAPVDAAKSPVSVEAKNSRAKRQTFTTFPTTTFTGKTTYPTMFTTTGMHTGFYPYTFPYYNTFYGY